MLEDIPYSRLKDNGRQYAVWIYRDIQKRTWADIASEYGISLARIRQYYWKTMTLRTNYYVNHLSIAYGHDNTEHFHQIYMDALRCYNAIKYVVAYFEKEYSGILREYRAGEPGMPEHIFRDLPPYLTAFSEQAVSGIIEMREVQGLTFGDIGKRLSMTREKADDLYNQHYYDLFMAITKKIMDDTGDKHIQKKYSSGRYVGSGKAKYDNLIHDYPEFA